MKICQSTNRLCDRKGKSSSVGVLFFLKWRSAWVQTDFVIVTVSRAPSEFCSLRLDDDAIRMTDCVPECLCWRFWGEEQAPQSRAELYCPCIVCGVPVLLGWDASCQISSVTSVQFKSCVRLVIHIRRRLVQFIPSREIRAHWRGTTVYVHNKLDNFFQLWVNADTWHH